MAQQREGIRRQTPPNTVAIEQSTAKGYGELCDISLEGTRIRTPYKIEPGEKVQLIFKLPPAKTALKALGTIVWGRYINGEYEAGVKTTPTDERLHNVIQRFFEQDWNEKNWIKNVA